MPTSKSKPSKPKPLKAKPSSKPSSLQSVFDSLRSLMTRHVPPFSAASGQIRNKADFHLVVPKPVAIPGAYGGKPYPIAMASIILQSGYVGFYYMPIYMEKGTRAKLSPALLKLLKGKSCFYVKSLDSSLESDIASALVFGESCFRAKGWL